MISTCITLYFKSLRASIALALPANLMRISLDLAGSSHKLHSCIISSCLIRLASSCSSAVGANISARRTVSSIFFFKENKPKKTYHLEVKTTAMRKHQMKQHTPRHTCIWKIATTI